MAIRTRNISEVKAGQLGKALLAIKPADRRTIDYRTWYEAVCLTRTFIPGPLVGVFNRAVGEAFLNPPRTYERSSPKSKSLQGMARTL